MKSSAAVLALLLLLLLPLSSRAEPARSFEDISEVVTQWNPQQKLWVRGSIGLGGPQQAALESWLDENGPNWTVVLMQNARGQRYDNRTGMSAVEFALGEGLSNRTGFGELVDERTGEKNGAVFVLFLEERKFSYFASETFDKRGLGERYWIGRLDKPAISAMRNGGRIADAVKDTVSGIQNSLSRKLADEAERERLAGIERQRAIDEAKQLPARLDQRIREAVSRGEQLLRESAAAADGPVFSPDLTKWEANRESIRKLVAIGSLPNAQQRYAETVELIDRYEAGLALWEKAPERFARLEKQIAGQVDPEEAPFVAGFLSRSRQALASARTNHAAGEPLYLGQLEEAERNYDRAAAAYLSWVESERRKRLLLQIIAIAAGVAFLLFLIVANRLRRPAREEAHRLFETWREILDGKFDELFSLMDRTGLIVGSSADLEERGFSGRTESLARETIRDVDELFIMSAATDRVMEQVENLITPRATFARILNAFSSRRYRKAVSLLETDPIGFDRKDHLEIILRPADATIDGEQSPTRSLLGEADDYEPFRISFEQLNEEYDRRQARAKDEITRLETAIDGLPLTQQDLFETLGETAHLADSLAARASEDTFFPLVSLRRAFLPAAKKQLSAAGELGESDPVAAYEDLLPGAMRLVTESHMVVSTLESFRSVDLPTMQRTVVRLNAQKRSSAWVDDALDSLVRQSEQLIEAGVETSLAEDWSRFDDELTRLRGRVVSCEALSGRIIEEFLPRLETVEAEIDGAKQDLGAAMQLSPDLLLEEPGLAPSERVASARRGIDAALASIDRGEALAAQHELSAVEGELDEAAAMIELSRECVERHAALHAELTGERERLLAERGPAAALLGELQDGYAPTVLTFHSRFGEATDGQLTIGNSVDRAERRLEQSALELEESLAAFRTGRLIRAYTLLETVANELGFADHQLALIRDQHAALREAEATNAKRAESLRNQLEELITLGEDRRTIQSTITELRQTGEELLEHIDSLGTEGADPFLQFRDGEELERLLAALRDGIEGDWKAHEMAEGAETSAKAALTYCHQYLHEARTDNIPDSRTLTRAIQRHGELTVELEKIDGQLKGAHADWNELFARISEMDGETAKVRSTLEEQLAAARSASKELSRAASEIRNLTKWRSSHSVRIDRRTGSKQLLAAKQALAFGNYAEARKQAVSARGAAIRELQRGKTKEAQAASAAAAAVRTSLLSSSSSSSGSFSSSSFSGSGFSSSGFSSGSGFSRSGW